MYILGVHNGLTAGATLMQDGRIITAVNEERFNRKKMYWGFPHESVRYILESNDLDIKDIDHIAYGFFKGMDANVELVPYIVRGMEAARLDPEAAELVRQRISSEQENDQKEIDSANGIFQKWGVLDRVRYFDHHMSHAAAALYTSPFDEALIVTSDGRGDFKSTTVNIGSRKKGIRLIDFRTTLDSLGCFYGAITSICGYKPKRHEGKITGLAAHGDPSVCMPIMKRMIDIKDGTIKANIGKWFKPFDSNHPKALLEALSKHSKEDIAAAAQKHIENIFVTYISKFLKEYKMDHICLAGGVFANVRVNQMIREIDGVKNIYIHPNMGDGGIATGGALLLSYELGFKTGKLENVYLGPGYTDEEVEKLLKEKYPDLKVENVKGKRARKIVEYIRNNKVIGFFEGRMEYGPRALGARTILYHANDKSVNDWLNRRLQRTEFMPFAPVTIEELAPRCYKGWKPNHIASRFMTICYDCTDEFAKNSPAVVHVDGTARPQVIRREDNPDYYDTVKLFYEKTGALSMINTSFNQHEEPIVCTPEDAVGSLRNNNVDILSIGNLMVFPPGK
jgi:carbamoyltransferase